MIADRKLPVKTKTLSSHDHCRVYPQFVISEPQMQFIDYREKTMKAHVLHANDLNHCAFDDTKLATGAYTIHGYPYKRAVERKISLFKILRHIENNAISHPTYADRNFIKLKKQFNERLESFKSEDFLKQEVEECFNSVVNHICKLTFNDALIFINNTNKIKFSMVFSENRVLVINKSFELSDELNGDNLIIFSLFIENELVASGVNEISKFVNEFKKYLDS